MKNLMILCLFVLAACTSKPTKNGAVEKPSPEKEMVAAEEVEAVCVWDKVSVRTSPSSKGKWKTSISIGEKLFFLGMEETDSLDKERKYVRVRLADGTEGWSSSDFIIPSATVGAFLEEASIYKRPDLLTKTDRKFDQMDIVAVKSKNDDWLEVVGKRKEGKWIDAGWVKNGNLTKKPVDIAVAKFARLALSEETEADQVERLKEIIDNGDFSSSSFIYSLREKYNSFVLKEENGEEALSEPEVADSLSVQENQ